MQKVVAGPEVLVISKLVNKFVEITGKKKMGITNNENVFIEDENIK